MYIFQRVADLQSFLEEQGKSIGFVPTMGALHQGHISLIERSKQQNELTVCSIFVNPLQFNDPKDLEKYPRPVAADIEKLAAAACDVLFLPDVEEMYPQGTQHREHYDFGFTGITLEAEFRPGHFDGVAQVVKRLLDIVRPHRLYMGLKDFQQVLIVEQMMEQHRIQVELVKCDTLREADGLAMSSRNMRLSPEARALAPRIYNVLQQAAAALNGEESIENICAAAKKTLEQDGAFRVDYFEGVSPKTLQPLHGVVPAGTQVLWIVAAFLDGVRLIDNLLSTQQ